MNKNPYILFKHSKIVETKSEDGGYNLTIELGDIPKCDVVMIHKLLNYMLEELRQKAVNNNEVNFNKLFGEDEKPIGALIKLSGIFIKLHPVEQAFRTQEDIMSLGAATKELLISEEFARQYAQATSEYECK